MHRALLAEAWRHLTRPKVQAPSSTRLRPPIKPSRRYASAAVAATPAEAVEVEDEIDRLDLLTTPPLRRIGVNEFLTFPSASNPSKVYTVLRSAGGRISCDCPAWRFQKLPQSEKSCKHIREAMGEEWERERVARERGCSMEQVTFKGGARRSAKKPGANQGADQQSVDTVALGEQAVPKRRRRKAATIAEEEAPPAGVEAATPKRRGRRKKSGSAEAADEFAAVPLGSSPLAAPPTDFTASGPFDVQPPKVLLANTYSLAASKSDPTGWWVSEKLDGVRLVSVPSPSSPSGVLLLSRNAKPFHAPEWWLASLPRDITLDGEAWMGRGSFRLVTGTIKRGPKKMASDEVWCKVRFMVFDILGKEAEGKTFEERQEVLRGLFPSSATRVEEQTWPVEGSGAGEGASPGDVVELVKHVRCDGKEHLLQMHNRIQSLGGEGLMLRKPNSLYEGKRSSTLLKLKSFHDADALVLSHLPGEGKHYGRIGALRCRTPQGAEFSIGSGLDDEERMLGGEIAPKVGDVVTYRYQEVGEEGVPRFPVYVGIAVGKSFE